MAEKFVNRNTVEKGIHRKVDKSKFGNEFLDAGMKASTKPEIIPKDTDNKPVAVLKSAVEYQQIRMDDITPRCINKYRQSRIEQLAKSIKNTNNRLIHPIVLVRAADLPKEHEVRKELEAKGQNIEDLKYIIVSGERRYHAWQLLREKAPKRLGKDNPFDTITANVLTKTEALNEKAFYADANNQARHMTPAEAVWFIKDALSELDTNEKKREALIRLNGGSEEGIPRDPEEAAKTFRNDVYCKRLLEDEMGISDWSDGTLRNMATVAIHCDNTVADALLSGEFALREAKVIAPLEKEQQAILVEAFKEDRNKYNELLLEFKGFAKKKPAKVTHADTRRQLKASLKRIKSERNVLEKYANGLGSKYNRNELDAIKKYDAFIQSLEELIENTK